MNKNENNVENKLEFNSWIMNKNIPQKIDTRKYGRKNTLFGFKFKFLGRTPLGNFLTDEQSIKRCATIVYQAFFTRGLIVKNVFLKPQTLDFFIATEKNLVSLKSLDKNWVNEYMLNWGIVFLNATVGQYTLYEEQYEDITNIIRDLVMDIDEGYAEQEDIWFKKERELNLINFNCREIK